MKPIPDRRKLLIIILEAFTWSLAACRGSCFGRIESNFNASWQPHPNEKVPYGFEVATLNGNFVLDPAKGLGVPLICYAYLPEDATLRYMWSEDNEPAIAAFLDGIPADTHVLFISYGLDAAEDMEMMRKALLGVLGKQGLEAIAEKRLKNFHFAKAPMSGVSDQGANFLPYLMGHWTSSRSVVETGDHGVGVRLIERLDAPFDWIPRPPPEEKLALIPFGDGCTDPEPFNVYGGVALALQKAPSSCSFAEMLSRAQAANASALLVSSVKGKDVVEMRCSAEECSLQLTTFGSMIPYDSAVKLQEAACAATAANRKLEVSFATDTGPGYYAAVDELGRLQEVGWLKIPSLQHLSWAGQWLEYARHLRAKLREPALVVHIFKEKTMQGEHGVSVEAELPSKAELDMYTKVELDFELGCPGTLDSDCPIWDHVVQLFVCCDDDPNCQQCDITPWLHQHHPDDASESEWQKAVQAGGLSGAKARCGRELGRWVTPFRRRIGRWLTDVTPLRSLISSQKCTFTVQSAPWAMPWKPSLQLRFSKPHSHVSKEEPNTIIPLFEGGTFDAKYNSRPPLHITIPAGISKVLLYAVITGHGSDEHNCAEFCPTSHHFTVNGRTLTVNFTEAGTQWGCTKHVLEGVVPNEHGTWQYGRGGWCDGVDVKPWVFDVSDAITPDAEVEISYRGLFQGKTPNPMGKPGYIMMQSSLVLTGSTQTDSLYSR